MNWLKANKIEVAVVMLVTAILVNAMFYGVEIFVWMVSGAAQLTAGSMGAGQFW